MSKPEPTTEDPFWPNLIDTTRPIPTGEHPEISTPEECERDRRTFCINTKTEKDR